MTASLQMAQGLPIRGPQRLSPYANGSWGLAVLKQQVSLFLVSTGSLVIVVPWC